MPEPQGGEAFGAVDEVRERAQEAGLAVTPTTQLRMISPRSRLQYPVTVRGPSMVPGMHEESELVYLTRPLSQKMGKADLVLGYAPLADVLLYFWWTLDE